MKYEIEHKTSHHEWDEVTIQADDFFKLFKTAFYYNTSESEDVLETNNYKPTFHCGWTHWLAQTKRQFALNQKAEQ